jgi:two-component system nitrogen regulation sensor histidine kinase NtrY
VHSLRNRLIIAFFIATAVPLVATIGITTSLLERSLGYATTAELDRLSRTLEATVRQFYQREREALKQDAVAGRATHAPYVTVAAAAWPEPVRAFWDSGETERFNLSGPGGNHLDYMLRTDRGVDVFSRDLGGIHMQELSAAFRQARELVGSIEVRDLRRGFTLALLLMVALVWIVSLAPLMFIAHRISKPIRQLTAGLTDFAAGDWDRRLETGRNDEVGHAVDAFNHMAEQLRRGRERLVYLTQMSSWQSLARKTAHELKNSLTPIRLTVEEMIARQPQGDRDFMQEAAQIVISEIETLERRVRAFSEFSSEPPVNPEALDINPLVTERVSLLKPAHPDTTYCFKLDVRGPRVHAGADLVKGILTNLLENAAEAAGAGGSVVTITRLEGEHVIVEVHDSGPGISDEASPTLFEPTITFKKHGMGLGLSIARKNALLLGGDITLVHGDLGGAGFRVALPAAASRAPSGSVRTVPVLPPGFGESRRDDEHEGDQPDRDHR